MTRFAVLTVVLSCTIGLAWAGNGNGKGKPGGGGGGGEDPTPLTNPAFVYIGKAQGAKVKGERKDELFVMSSDGTASESLGVGGLKLVIQDAAWSPDGEWIAFHANSLLYVIKPDGTSLTKLIDNDGVQYIKGAIDWSPDAKYIAYARQFDDEIEVVRVATGTTTTLSTGSYPPNNGGDQNNRVSWSIDLDDATAGSQTKIAYVHGTSPEVYLLPVDIAAAGTLSVGTPSKLTDGGGFRPFFARDGRTVYFREQTGTAWHETVWSSIPADGSEVAEEIEGTDNAYFLDVSPDEAYLVWSEAWVGDGDLYRREAGTGSISNLTSSSAEEASPRWNPAWSNDLD